MVQIYWHSFEATSSPFTGADLGPEADVKSEVGTLRKTAVFGPPGIESYLLQFYQKQDSLFFDEFNVHAARREFERFVDLFWSQGVEVIDLKRVFVSTLPNPAELGIDAGKLVGKLSEKVPMADKGTIEDLLQEDAIRYGEAQAVSLAYSLCLVPNLPLGNIYFGRDPMNHVMDTAIVSNMKFPARKAESAIYRAAFEALGYHKFLAVTDGNFEGGDGMLLKGSIYVGNGMRTDLDAANQIAEYFKNRHGIKTYVVFIPPTGSWKENMDQMHLDTYLRPIDDHLIIGCGEQLEPCQVIDLSTGKKSPLLRHLHESGYEVDLGVPRSEQINFALNMTMIGPRKAIIPKDGNHTTERILKKYGVEYTSAQFTELTKGAGSTNCSHQPVVKN